ncbi:MAG: glycosyltransferase [Bacteroidia bacterium]|nr:glycosyltransferase [Bacteroidia bacterium]
MSFTAIIQQVVEIFNISILIFAVFIMSSYLILGLISIRSLREYLRNNEFINYNVLLSSENSPSLSLIAPAYNEGKTIEENIQSLLSLNYSNYEVIIVNDGSKDNSMEIMIKTYHLEIDPDFQFPPHLKAKEIKGIYRSKNPAYKKLIVVDKINGGKSDALNMGINISSKPYIVCIDVDCIIEKDALLKMAKPFMENINGRVIATGGVIRIANSCKISNGRLVEVNVPETFIPRIQVIEYLRAFLLGRMAWAKLDGLLLISGAFGMFDKQIVIESGGYDHNTVGEDMELVMRMRRYMIETNQKYIVSYIPDPLCWTEAPDNFSILRRQRSRWTRGTMESLWKHRIMFLNPRYKLLGLLSFPYWLIFEYFAPLIEFFGLIVTLLFFAFGLINLKFFCLLLLFVYSFAIMVSTLALLTEEYTFHQYPKIKHYFQLLLVAIIEPFYYHPFLVYSALKGNWEKIKGIKTWGDMTRGGFTKK